MKYGVLAEFYEDLICDCDYEKWSQYVCKNILKYAPSLNGVDFACGTGYFTRALATAGCDVIGADISNEMLSEALSRSEGCGITYVHQDMTKPCGFRDLGFITVINDGVNYIPQKSVRSLFERFGACLKKGGILLFDVSSPYKLREILGNNLFGEDLDEVTYLWFNRLKKDSVQMDLSFFVPKGDCYERFDERHVQYIHEQEDLERALCETGFRLIRTDGDFGRKLKEDSRRIHVIAEKER